MNPKLVCARSVCFCVKCPDESTCKILQCYIVAKTTLKRLLELAKVPDYEIQAILENPTELSITIKGL